MAELTLAWVLRRTELASAIVGATRPDQVQANAEALGIQLTPDTLAAVEEAFGRHPGQGADPRPPGPARGDPPRRGQAIAWRCRLQWAKGDLNPHPLAGTWPSTMRVCLFRHSPLRYTLKLTLRPTLLFPTIRHWSSLVARNTT
jgi:aldo/keto reductase family protein